MRAAPFQRGSVRSRGSSSSAGGPEPASHQSGGPGAPGTPCATGMQIGAAAIFLLFGRKVAATVMARAGGRQQVAARRETGWSVVSACERSAVREVGTHGYDLTGRPWVEI